MLHHEPVEHEPEEDLRAMPQAYCSPSTLPDNTGKPKIVVVDDEPAIVEVVCAALDDVDVAADSCPHGTRAHACIRDKQPKAVILDIQMPGVDGIQLFRQIRADPNTSAIPVIFFTANAHVLRERLPNYRAMGAELLPKPFDVDRLLDLVERTLAA